MHAYMRILAKTEAVLFNYFATFLEAKQTYVNRTRIYLIYLTPINRNFMHQKGTL